METILSSKRQMRRELAKLPYEEKVEMVKKLRERSQQLASNPLRQPFISSVVVSGARVDSVSLGGQIREWTPLAVHQLQDAQHIPQTSEISIASLSSRNEWSKTIPEGVSGQEYSPLSLALFAAHLNRQKRA